MIITTNHQEWFFNSGAEIYIFSQRRTDLFLGLLAPKLPVYKCRKNRIAIWGALKWLHLMSCNLAHMFVFTKCTSVIAFNFLAFAVAGEKSSNH